MDVDDLSRIQKTINNKPHVSCEVERQIRIYYIYILSNRVFQFSPEYFLLGTGNLSWRKFSLETGNRKCTSELGSRKFSLQKKDLRADNLHRNFRRKMSFPDPPPMGKTDEKEISFKARFLTNILFMIKKYINPNTVRQQDLFWDFIFYGKK